MGIYAQPVDVRLWLLDSDVAAPGDDDAIERLIARAERRVDLALGRYPESPPGALKVDPATLTEPQQRALARATCAAAEHELLVGVDYLAGGDDYLSGIASELEE